MESAPSSDQIDDLLGTSPMDKMISSIDEQVKSDTEHELSGHMAVLGRSLDDDIEKAAELRNGEEHYGDIGEGNDATASAHAQTATQAAVLKALHDAQKALDVARMSSKAVHDAVSSDDVHKSVGEPVATGSTTGGKAPQAKFVKDAKKTPSADSMERATEQLMNAGDSNDGADPIDEMKSVIDAQVHAATVANTAPDPADPLDKAISRIPAMRARERKKAHRREETDALSMIQIEQTAPGDPGETLPPGKNAPPGPPNPAVKEVTKEVPGRLSLGRSTAEAPAAGAGLDAALSNNKGAASVTGPADAPTPAADKDFSKHEIDDEMKAIDGYPIGKDEAIKEYVKQMVPWHQRPDAPGKVSKGPVVAEKEVNTTAPDVNVTSNSSNPTTVLDAASEAMDNVVAALWN